jgi:hypothetical protein
MLRAATSFALPQIPHETIKREPFIWSEMDDGIAESVSRSQTNHAAIGCFTFSLMGVNIQNEASQARRDSALVTIAREQTTNLDGGSDGFELGQ